MRKHCMAFLAAIAATCTFGIERNTNSYTRAGVEYAQRGGLAASDYVVTDIDENALLESKRDKTDLKVYRKVKDCWTWKDWDGFKEVEPSAKEAPADFLAIANSPGSETIHFENDDHAWHGAVQFWPNGKARYKQSEVPPEGSPPGEFATNVNFEVYAYDETGTNEIYRFGATATRTDPTNETIVAWDGSRNEYIRIATTDIVDELVKRGVAGAVKNDADYQSVRAKANGAVQSNSEEYKEVSHNARLARLLGDFGVYRANEFSDFTYSSSSRPDIADYLNENHIQPDIVEYEYNDGELNLDFSYQGHWWYGYYYGSLSQESLTMTLDSYWYDDEGNSVYDSADITLLREVFGYDKSNPIDSLVKNSELNNLRDTVNSIGGRVSTLEGQLGNEEKVLRTGKEREYGVGWGYEVTDKSTGDKTWRIRVPNFTSTTGTGNEDKTTVSTYWLANPHTWIPQWKYKYELVNTSDSYGSDAVNSADYIVTLFTASTNTLAPNKGLIRYNVKQISTSPRAFSVTPITEGLRKETRSGVEVYGTPIEFQRTYETETYVHRYNYGTKHYTNHYIEEGTPAAIYVEPKTLVYTNKFVLQFNVLMGNDRVWYWQDKDGAITTNNYLTQNGRYLTARSVTVNVASGASFMNVYAPKSKAINSINNGYYYDQAIDCTWKVDVTNGVFFGDIKYDYDWRKE